MSHPRLCSRRHLLHSGAFSLAGLGLASLLRDDGLLAAPVKPLAGDELRFDLLPKTPPQPARATAMISLFMMGGPSQMDLFDPKPLLSRYDGQTFPGEIKYDNLAEASAKVLGPGWRFAPRGACGMELSDLLPHLAGVCDDVTLIRSMHSGVNNHGQALYALNAGRINPGRPTLGAWLCYGLGSETQDLPAYMVLAHPGGLPTFQGEHWTNGWLPSLYSGTLVRAGEPRMLNLDPAPLLRGAPQARQLALLERLDAEHAAAHPGEHDLDARIKTYALAARMQSAAKEALDIASEPAWVHRMYGVDEPATADYGTRCLIARRLVERGVRYVQVLNSGQSWDHHGGIKSALPASCLAVDKPSAALVADLKQRGLLGSTVVHWGGEMGRLPVLQNDGGPEKWGRDHNTYGFSQWVAGGGFKAGCTFGETDEWSHKAVQDVVHHYDWHATLLHLFGFDHRALVYKREGLAASLTDGQDARVVDGILA